LLDIILTILGIGPVVAVIVAEILKHT